MKLYTTTATVLMFIMSAGRCSTESNTATTCRNVVYRVQNMQQCCSNSSGSGAAIDDIKKLVASMQAKLTALEIKDVQRESQVNVLQSKYETMQARYDLVTEKYQTIQTKYSDLKKSILNPVAFHARSNQTQTLNKGERIMFRRVTYNQGNAFDVTTGIFTCPDNDIYSFFVSILSGLGTDFYFRIMQESKFLMRGYTGRADGRGYHSASQLVTTRCARGNRVWVERVPGNYGGAVVHGGWNGFSGFKVGIYDD